MAAVGDIYADNGAMLLEMLSPAAIVPFLVLCEEAAFVTPRVVTVRTTSSSDVWRTLLDQTLFRDAENAVLRVKRRPSRQGGGTWASPSATSPQLAAHRRTAGRSGAERQIAEGTAEISINGSLGHGLTATVRQLMSVIEGRLGTQLRELGPDDVQSPSSWLHLVRSDPSVPTGRIRLQLASRADVDRLATEVHGRAVQIGADLLTISVLGDGLQQLPGNLRRRRGQRPPVSA